MVTLRTKRRKNATKTINTGIETQVNDRITVNREIAVSSAMKIITSNETMETLTVVKVEATVMTQEADPVTITAKGEETKTETETITDKIDIDKTTEAKITATRSQHRYITHYQERRRENKTHQIDTDNKSNDGQDSYVSNKSHDNTSDNEFYFADKKFHDINKTNDEKENDEPVKVTDDESMISYVAEDNEDTEPMIEKTYQDDLIPLQGELLNTEIAEPIVTPILKQELTTVPKLYSRSQKILKQCDLLSYKP
jgi:hypothetical protein